MPALIEVQQLNKSFTNFRAVKNLSFTVEQGDVYGFLGQNGAGKSTTIRMMLSLISPDSGSIRIFGKELSTHRNEILRRVGAVIERPDLYKYLSARENLEIFARMSGLRISGKEIMTQLEQVGIAERSESKVKTFSQGMKQRLGIAVALIHNPDLIILDEPTNGLDPQGIADIRNLILHLSRNLGKTVVVSSHLLNEIEMVASRMLIIDRGEKKAEGRVSELFDPSKTIVELELANAAALKDSLCHGPYAANIRETKGEKISFIMNKTEIPGLATYLVQHDAQIISLNAKHSLEDYFLSLTTANQHVDAFTN